ncbi:MAG: hypothetical protein Q8R53_06120 [Nanoarchaeota archaeon]|nr:hypothetical protein [Nanoarchaeota archaeon]
MDSMMHYTSWNNWKKIQETGFLLPNSLEYIFSDRIQSPPWYFLVGIPHHYHEGWVSSGSMRELIIHTLGAEVMLQVPIVDKENAFIREHVHFSPQRLAEVGIDFYCSDQSNPRLQEAHRKYAASTIRLTEYDGDYQVPEILLPQTIPVNELIDVVLFPEL